MIRKFNIVLILATFTFVTLNSYGRSVDIIINQNENRIVVNDPYQPEFDTTRYDYISPDELKVYYINKFDTLCVFVSPCVTEYLVDDDKNCSVYLWPSRIICPDDCVCLMEDEESGCIKYIEDAELCLSIKIIDGKLVFQLNSIKEVLQMTRHYSQMLIDETNWQKESGTLKSMLFWTNVYESIIHNYLLFHVFSNRILTVSDIKFLSEHLRHL